MTTETILTDDELRHHQGQNLNTIGAIADQITSCIKAGRAIEQAVLQSPEVQAWKRDAERYRWLRGQCEKLIGGLTICEVGLFELKPWSGVDPDRNIDAAMEQQTWTD